MKKNLEMNQLSEFTQWIQRAYIAVPGPCSVPSGDMYAKYTKENANKELMTKKKCGLVVPVLFDKVKVCHANGPNIYKGLRLSFDENKAINMDTVINISSRFGYVKMSETNGIVKLSCYTGYTVNTHEQMKNIAINVEDRSIQISIGGRIVPLSDICLTGLVVRTEVDARVLFNTVKQFKVCCGKPVESKLNTTKYSCVQEWYMKGDENSAQLRLTSKKCKAVVLFLSSSNICFPCQKQYVNRVHTRSDKDKGQTTAENAHGKSIRSEKVPNPPSTENPSISEPARKKMRQTTPGKGKGRGKGKTQNSKVVKYVCPACREECREDEEECIQCDDCNDWFHRTCENVSDEQWVILQSEDVPWSCSKCAGN